ncbi:MAG: hypothetical protein IT548_12990 [Alphaproteobacteria bacterium]|nr:hypothetical protein [Alphaproteobacteria bacterium]
MNIPTLIGIGVAALGVVFTVGYKLSLSDAHAAETEFVTGMAAQCERAPGTTADSCACLARALDDHLDDATKLTMTTIFRSVHDGVVDERAKGELLAAGVTPAQVKAAQTRVKGAMRSAIASCAG